MNFVLYAGFRFPARAEDFSSLHSVQPGFGALLASHTMDTGGSFPGRRSGWGVKLTTHLYVAPRSRIVELYLHSPTLLHGLVLN
jgi:hypothetical protein